MVGGVVTAELNEELRLTGRRPSDRRDGIITDRPETNENAQEWRTDFWDGALVSGLLTSTSVHLLIVFAATAWGIAQGDATKPNRVHLVQRGLRPDVTFDLDEESFEGSPETMLDADSMAAELVPLRIVSSRESSAPGTKHHPDWPTLEVPVPIPPIVAPNLSLDRPIRRLINRESTGTPGERAMPQTEEETSPPATKVGSGCAPSQCGAVILGDRRGRRCTTKILEGTTMAAFRDLKTFWDAHAQRTGSRPGRMILQWRINGEGGVSRVEVLRDDVQDATVRRWALERVRRLHYDASVASGCGIRWHLGFGVNLVGLDESLGQMARRLVADSRLTEEELQEVQAMIYDDLYVCTGEMAFLQWVTAQVEPESQEPSWAPFLMNVMNEYLEGIDELAPIGPSSPRSVPKVWQVPS